MKRENIVDYKESSTVQRMEGLEQANCLDCLEPITLYQCGIEQCNPKCFHGTLSSDHYLIHMVLSGKGYYSIGKKAVCLKTGDACLIRPNQESSYRADENEPWKYAWIGFHGYSVESVIKEMGYSEDNGVIHLDQMDRIHEIITRILDLKEVTYVNELRRKSHFYSILSYLIEGHEKEKVVTTDTSHDDPRKLYVRRAVEYMMSSYNKKIRISDIASEIGLNRSYFTNIFKKEMNMSPQDFLITLRLEKAAQMLRETNESIRTVAFSSGYDDSLSFSKAFKQKYHITPSEYRASQMQSKIFIQ